MLSVRLTPDLERQLRLLSRKSGQSQARIVREALREYMDEPADYYAGVSVLKRSESTSSLDEVVKRLDLKT